MNPLRYFDIKFMKGIGPHRAEILKKELGITTYHDLLYHFPLHYVDRSRIYSIKDFSGDMPTVVVKGRFISFSVHGEGAKMRLTGLFTDGTATMEVVWFNRIRTFREAYHPGTDYLLFGKPTLFGTRWSMAHPEIDIPGSSKAVEGLRGVYPLTEKLRSRNITSRTLSSWITTIFANIKRVPETLPASVTQSLGLMPLHDALVNIHTPRDNAALQAARLRLKFEEVFMIQVSMLRLSRARKQSLSGYRFPRIGYYFNTFYERLLPFPLTGAQKRVMKEIRADMSTGQQMNRLLQGDVGSGKTLVAAMTMLIGIDNGTQGCLMAPTEILATQHYQTLTELLAPAGVCVRLLTGSTPAKTRKEIHAGLLDGSIHILVGTHAVIEDTVQFKALGVVVIDEQHRFGVAQRARLWNKNSAKLPHILVMTATPIPRTLAMTVYGDLDVSVIDEMPPGRKPVATLLRYDNQRLQVYKSVYKELRAGRQVYIVYPLVKENEKLDLISIQEGYEYVRQFFPTYKVACVHGKMRPEEKDHQMQLFASGEAQILVATTVIEVGVNVPNATVMLIECAERFGLSQLHQLRGRVGRGGDQSYCVLMTKHKIAKETRRRLEIMTSTTDGFVIAEADMKMRGPGDIEGTQQSGTPFDLKIADLAHDGQIVQMARDAAERLLDSDPVLTHHENSAFLSEMLEIQRRTVDWSRIS